MSRYGGGGRAPPDTHGMVSLKVDGISSRTVVEDLRDLFGKFGQIGDIYIPREKVSGEHRGFAFVRFYDKDSAEDAIDSMDGRRYEGRELGVTLARYGRTERLDLRSRSRSRERRRSRSRGRGRSRSRSRSRRRERSRSSRSRSRSRSRDRKSRSRSRRRSGEKRRGDSKSGSREKRSRSRERRRSRSRSYSRSRS